MATKFSFDVFLSHNSKDKARVRRLAKRLKEAGLRVWFDEWIIKAGDDIYLSIEQGLQSTRVQVLCLSPAALGSDWVSLERSTVLFRDPANKSRRFIPLLLMDCDLPDVLRRYKYVDFRDETDEAFDELLDACRVTDEVVSEALLPEQTKKANQSLIDKPFSKSEKLAPKPTAPQEKVDMGKESEPTPSIATLERKLTGHKGWVNSVVVSPDGKWIASGGDDKTVRIWDIETGKCQITLTGHGKSVRCVAITPDGKRLLSASDDETVRVWNYPSGQLEHILTVYNYMMLAVVPFANGQYILSGGAGHDSSIKIWNLNTGVCTKTLQVNQIVWSADINSDGTIVALGGDKGKLTLWNLNTDECITVLNGHSSLEVVRSVKITSDGQYVISGSDDKTVKVWSLAMGTCIGTLEGHQKGIDSIAITSNIALIASTGFTDHTVRLWDRESGTCLQIIDIRETPNAVAFSLDGSRLVVGTVEGTIHIYRLTSVKAISSVEISRRYTNAKVVLVGESAVGKTTLAHRLIEDQYVKTDSTHGMNVWKLDLPLPEDETIEREALLWDLAGQEDYRLIHQLFLEETALALLLINPQKNDPFAETGDWLKALRLAVKNKGDKSDIARILIPTRLDVGGMKVSDKKIQQFVKENGFLDCLPTSAKRGDNCSDRKNGKQPSALKQLIAQHIPWDKLPWTSTPRLLAELKNSVIAMRDQADIRLLRFAELAQRLEQALPAEKFGEPEARTAVTLLANHGLVRPLKFGDLVLLRPELLNGYAAAIIRSARAHKDEIGCVSEEAIYRHDFDFTGVERLKHHPDEELLLRALVQTFLDNALCIAEETPEGKHLIFPSQYRRERDIPTHPEIFISYRFTGEWQTIYTTLVVRLWYSREFQQRELWRNAAEFETSKNHTLGLMVEKTGEGEAAISVFFDAAVPDELKVIFIEYVHRHLAKYAQDVHRDRRYVCTKTDCGRPFKDYDLIREMLAEGIKTIVCQKCRTEVELIDHIEQRLSSDPVARRVLSMEETARQELDTQALEQILIGHMMAITGEANQIFRELTKFDYGIDGEVEFKDKDGAPSGKKIYIQLKNGGSYLRKRKADGKEIFDVKNERHLEYWINQPVDVYLVIRDAEETIRWMNITRYLKERKDKKNRQIIFDGEKLDLKAVWGVRDQYFSPRLKA
jgi:small GTP-binding protein